MNDDPAGQSPPLSPPVAPAPVSPSPPRPRRWGAFRTLLALLLAGWGVWFAFLREHHDWPVHEGRTVEEWFYGESGHCGQLATIQAAEAVFREMGTNGLPFLYHNLRRTETWPNRLYLRLHPRFPSWLRARARPALSVDYIKMVTVRHLGVLAQSLSFDPTELKSLTRTTEDAELRLSLLLALDRLYAHWRHEEQPGDRIDFYVSMLRDPSFPIRLQTALLLAEADRSVTNAVPILLDATTNRAFMVATFPQPAQALVVGGGTVSDQALAHQQRAHDALSRVAPELARTHEVVTNVSEGTPVRGARESEP